MRFQAACIQTNVQDSVSENIEHVFALVRRAGNKGATFIALPENSFQMVDAASKKALDVWPVGQHPGVLAMAELAREYAAWLLIGSVPTQAEGDQRLLNTSVLLNPEGNIATLYHKIHLFDVDLGGGEVYSESRRFAPGQRAIVVETGVGAVGMSICYDVRFPHLYRQLAQAGADILTVPAAFTAMTGKAHWHVLNRARAIENGCFVIAPAQVGMHPGGRSTFGHSLIINPWGEVLADGGEEVGVTLAEIDLSAVKETRRRIPSLLHDREFVVCSSS